MRLLVILLLLVGCTKEEFKYVTGVKRQPVKQKTVVRSDSIAPPSIKGIVEEENEKN